MVEIEKEKLKASLFYRLVDEKPHLKTEKRSHQVMGIREFHEEIRQNLENILNTRAETGFVKSTNEIKKSLLNYGIEDFSQSYLENSQAQLRLCQQIKEAINYFEPRLQNIMVVPVADESEWDRVLKLRIEGEIILKSIPIPAVFESSLDMLSQFVSVE